MKSSISRFPLTRRQTMHRQDGRQEIDRRTLLAKGAHLRRFSSQAAPGKNLGDSPPRVLDSFALDWNATLNRALRRAWLASSPADPNRDVRARQDGVRRSGHAPRHSLPNCLDDQAGDRDCGHGARRGRQAQDSTSRSTGCSLSWPTAECSGGSMRRSTTRCRPGGRLPSRIC